MSPKTVFIHGRPGPHPFHAALARAVGADFVPVDFLLRWHDRRSSRLRRYMSWILCAISFPNAGRYDVFLSEGPHFVPVIMRGLGRVRGRQKLVALMDNETLFFLKAGRYSATASYAQLWALRRYDVLMCVGRMEARLAESLVQRDQKPAVVRVRSGVAENRLPGLLEVRPELDARSLVFVGNGPDGWRGWYKGIDLLLEACGRVGEKVPVRLSIVGDWRPEYIREVSGELPPDRLDVRLIGHTDDPRPHLADAALYVHLGRGDAFGISVLEAMCAGLPALVSEWTGAAEAVERVDPSLVVPLDPEAAASRILWYLDLTEGVRSELSRRSREVASEYTEARAVREFVDAYWRAVGRPGP